MHARDATNFTALRQVTVEARARLHIGFLDLNFELGRRFGSLGLAIERPVTRLRLQAAARTTAEGPGAGRAREILLRMAAGGEDHYALTIEQAAPAHSGLGSGTQLALAIAAAVAAHRREAADIRAMSSYLDRGARSGVGIAVFERGGFVVDGGRGPRDEPAPVLSRVDFPESWRVLLVFDSDASGVHGEEEKAAFQSMRPAPAESAADACRRTLMQILPALIEEDLASFSKGVRAIQDGMAAQFAPYQGGSAFRSSRVREALAWVEGQGVYGTGQSSWGPTGFAFVTRAQGEHLLEQARQRFAGADGLSFDLVKGCNHGALVTVR